VALGRFSKGLVYGNADGGGVGSVTLAEVALAGGTTIVALIALDQQTAPDSVTWNGQALTLAVEVTQAGGPYAGIFYKANVTAGSGPVVLNAQTGDPSSLVMLVLEITGADVVPLDRTAAAAGSGTGPSSGPTSVTTSPGEILVGAIATRGPSGDAPGSWAGGFSAGLRAGTTGGVVDLKATLSEGYQVVAAEAAYTAAKTGITSRPWAAAIATFKAGPAGTEDLEVEGLVGDLEVFPALEGAYIGGSYGGP
jgi:hypothetical protein